MALTTIRRDLPYVKQGQDLCLYAAVEMLLRYNGIDNVSQYDLFKTNQSRVVQNIANTLKVLPSLKNLTIDYLAGNGCSLDKIKAYIRQDCPIIVNLYDIHHSNQGVGHSYVVKAFDDEIDQMRLIDPNQDMNQRETSISYNEFHQKWKNGPILELIAVKQNNTSI